MDKLRPVLIFGGLLAAVLGLANASVHAQYEEGGYDVPTQLERIPDVGQPQDVQDVAPSNGGNDTPSYIGPSQGTDNFIQYTGPTDAWGDLQPLTDIPHYSDMGGDGVLKDDVAQDQLQFPTQEQHPVLDDIKEAMLRDMLMVKKNQRVTPDDPLLHVDQGKTGPKNATKDLELSPAAKVCNTDGNIKCSDAEAKRFLDKKGVDYKKNACSDKIKTLCTSFGGMQPSTLEQMGRLKGACNCTLVITGGTEYGHTENGSDLSHANGYKYDAKKNTGLNRFIVDRCSEKNHCDEGERVEKNGNISPTYTYTINGRTVIYVDEKIGAPHWDITVAPLEPTDPTAKK